MLRTEINVRRLKADCKKNVIHLKGEALFILHNADKISTRANNEKIRFFTHCHNADVKKAKKAYDKLMLINQEWLDILMFDDRGGDSALNLETREWAVFKSEGGEAGGGYEETKGQDAQAMLMGKNMIIERECLEGWLWGASRYGHK